MSTRERLKVPPCSGEPQASPLIMYIYIYIFILDYIHIYMIVYIYNYIYTYTYIHIYICVYVIMYILWLYTYNIIIYTHVLALWQRQYLKMSIPKFTTQKGWLHLSSLQCRHLSDATNLSGVSGIDGYTWIYRDTLWLCQNSYWKWPFISWIFPFIAWWFSTVMLVYQRVPTNDEYPSWWIPQLNSGIQMTT